MVSELDLNQILLSIAAFGGIYGGIRAILDVWRWCFKRAVKEIHEEWTSEGES